MIRYNDKIVFKMVKWDIFKKLDVNVFRAYINKLFFKKNYEKMKKLPIILIIFLIPSKIILKIDN